MLVLLFIKKHWLKVLLSLVGAAIIALAFTMFRPDTYLPHKRIVLNVPYDLASPPTNLLPMGEKIYHANSPQGHPGIDFQWSQPNAPILASAAGKISNIYQTPEHFNNWDIEITSWPYVVRYKELEDYDKTLKKGSRVVAGQYLGHPVNSPAHGRQGAIQLHWEFGSLSLLRDRFCPMTYFDEASRKSVEAIWAKTSWQYKAQYPYVCSGDYYNKTE